MPPLLHGHKALTVLQPPYLDAMNESAITTTIAAQDAAEALIALGWPVLPVGTDWDLWKIGDFVLTDDDLIGLAARQGIRPVVERMQ